MPSNNDCEWRVAVDGEPPTSALKVVADAPAPLPDPISEWLDRASLGHARMETDPVFREQTARLIAQQLSRTPYVDAALALPAARHAAAYVRQDVFRASANTPLLLECARDTGQ
jgi:hypothetical protein